MKDRPHYQIVEDLQSSYRKWCLEEFARAGPLESSQDFQKLVVLMMLYSKYFPTATPPKADPVKPEHLPKGWPVEPDAPSFTPGRGIKKEEVKSEARGSTEGNLLQRILRRQQARPVSPDKVPVGTGDSSEELVDDSPPAWQEKKPKSKVTAPAPASEDSWTEAATMDKRLNKRREMH